MKVKILIVDDEKKITRSVTRYFKLLGYDVSSANSPIDALEKIKNENFMLVISDIMMPEMDGIEMLRQIKDFNGMIQVIMMTGAVTIENVLDCLSAGANDLFIKPLDDLESIKDSVDNSIAKLEKWEGIIKTMISGKH